MLIISAKKISLFQTKIIFLGHNIYQGTITPITRSIKFGDKFPNQLRKKTQLHGFLGCLTMFMIFYQTLE